MMMFDVNVGAINWRIRTEPVIECEGGIGYYEASLSTNDCILMVTGLESAYKSSESPFQSLRTKLKESKKDDVYFATANPKIQTAIPNSFSGSAAFKKMPVTSEKATANLVDNVAIADVLQSKYPRVDPSYVAFLCFAFTPPNEQKDGTNKMLLQIWDDGNRQKTRFRHASWNQFAEPPHLVSSAVYGWVGKQILPNGTLEDINTSDVSKPFDMAARYDVDVPTNCSGLKLPLSFKLTRFDTERSENKEPKVVSTVVASVIKVSLLTSNESLEVKVPGKTFVSDYRLSAGELKGAHLGYLLDSNTPPTTEQIKQGSLYKRTSEIAKTSPPKPYLRWALLAFLLAFPVVAIIFWKYLARTRESSNTVPSQ
ncbi:MAG: hypothetical protein IT579_24085 [Verrucomicrobia subdivision 3 bacterium]|nr:hypothetical protein [Verrucomicrobiota bacterium]MCC6823814.1 hypothetical protein [Limisphaerales bacterium]